MQFKNPEILYFLVLLLIPIIVHLFQLQRFTKVPFTNVAFLQKLVLQARKSSKLKKWLILCTRLTGLLAIILSFSQPFFSDKENTNEEKTFIYLDNSLSVNAKGEKGNLYQNSVQEIIENSAESNNYSLLTNTNFNKNLTKIELKKVLLSSTPEAKNNNFQDVLLNFDSKKENKTKASTNNILISDFQNFKLNEFTNVNTKISLIKLKNSLNTNLSIDSIYIDNNNSTNITLNIIVKNQGIAKENIPIALYNKNKLVNKQTFSIDENSQKKINFNIQKSTKFSGKIDITYSDTFTFDNTFYFSLNFNQKINILSIGKASEFLSKIYTQKDFIFSQSSVQNVNYNLIPKQQLIILNEIENIPSSLQASLIDFSKNGGDLVIIPKNDIEASSYNAFLRNLNTGRILQKKSDTLKITQINYNHPLFKDVFVKKVSNFQYPTTYNYFPTSFKNSTNIVSFENNEGFIKQITLANSKLYWISSPLTKEHGNFINSPLIVPVFFNFGQLSLQHSKLYYTINSTNQIDVNTKLNKDEVLTISGEDESFIPLQQTYQNKVSITTKDKPLKSGFYYVTKQQDTLQTIAYNYPKEESNLQFLDLTSLKDNENIKVYSSIKEALEEINKKNEVHWLWQWFLALAIVSLLSEILILKFFTP